MNISIHLTLLATIVTGSFTLNTNTAKANFFNDSLVAVDFGLPNDPVPNTSIGGGVRGQVHFALPGSGSPNNVEGAIGGDLSFVAPEDEEAPNKTLSGGVRGDVQFGLPGDATPNASQGGGVRGDVQFGLPGDATPNASQGGGVRGDLSFKSPEDDTQPDNTLGAGRRGNVPMVVPGNTLMPGSSIDSRDETTPLTALVPPTQLGRTISPRPTVYVYLPSTGAETIFFSVQDEEGNPHYHTTIEIVADGGVVSIPLPSDAPALEFDKNYLWYLAPIEPDGVLRPDNYAVTGWVKRVDTTVNAQDLVDAPVQLATEYAEAGIWYETVKVLVDAQRSEPDNQMLAQEWHDLLEQVGLEAIAYKPIYFRN